MYMLQSSGTGTCCSCRLQHEACKFNHSSRWRQPLAGGGAAAFHGGRSARPIVTPLELGAAQRSCSTNSRHSGALADDFPLRKWCMATPPGRSATSNALQARSQVAAALPHPADKGAALLPPPPPLLHCVCSAPGCCFFVPASVTQACSAALSCNPRHPPAAPHQRQRRNGSFCLSASLQPLQAAAVAKGAPAFRVFYIGCRHHRPDVNAC